MKISRSLIAEFVGTAGLLTVVVGSGIMGERLAQGNLAITLLANAIATGAGIYCLIQCFGPISGAHFNPAVTLVAWMSKKKNAREFALFSISQILGGVFGVLLTHTIFDQALIQFSLNDRGKFHLFLSEMVASFGLVTVIELSGKKSSQIAPGAVALYITSAYWFTSSTSFANPAATIARGLTNSFTGIHWNAVPIFIGAQVMGAGLAVLFVRRVQDASPGE